MPKYLVTSGNIQTVVDSDTAPKGGVLLEPGPLFTDDETLGGIFPEVFGDPVVPEIDVDFNTKNKVGITSNVDQVIAISGRVRDNDNVKLTAGKRKTYSLTKEEHDHVIVDGVEHQIPESKDTK